MADGHDIGDGLRAAASFTRKDSAGVDQPADPTTVTAVVRAPDGTTTPHAAVRDALGEYHFDLFPDAAGEWVVTFYGTGAVVAVVEVSFTVDAPKGAGARLGSYTDDPANVPRDRVRLELGDTRHGAFEFSDREVLWLLAEAGDDPIAAAAKGAHLLAARYAGEIDRSVGDVSRSMTQKARGYRDLARELDAKVAAAAASPVPIAFAGGIHDESGGPVTPYFSEDMFANSRPDDPRRYC